MNKKQAEDIYWVLSDKVKFACSSLDNIERNRIKKERVKIANRYMELKTDHDFLESEQIAIVEWLMNLQGHECEQEKL